MWDGCSEDGKEKERGYFAEGSHQGLSDKVTFMQNPEGQSGTSQEGICRVSFPGLWKMACYAWKSTRVCLCLFGFQSKLSLVI